MLNLRLWETVLRYVTKFLSLWHSIILFSNQQMAVGALLHGKVVLINYNTL